MITSLESPTHPLLWNEYGHLKTYKNLKHISHLPILRKEVAEDELYLENGESNPREEESLGWYKERAQGMDKQQGATHSELYSVSYDKP